METKMGLRTRRKLSYLLARHPDLWKRVEEGELSPDRAYRLAKGIPDQTVVDRVKKVWSRVSLEKRLDLASWILEAFVEEMRQGVSGAKS